MVCTFPRTLQCSKAVLVWILIVAIHSRGHKRGSYLCLFAFSLFSLVAHDAEDHCLSYFIICFLRKCLVRFFAHFGLVCICLGTWGEARGFRSMELKLQVVVSHLVWVPGMDLGSSGRAVGKLNCWAVSPAWGFKIPHQVSYLHFFVRTRCLSSLSSAVTKTMTPWPKQLWEEKIYFSFYFLIQD